MPLRPLKPDGQPKLDKDLTKNEVAGRVLEEEEDRRMAISRAARTQMENQLLAQANLQQARR